MKLKALLVAMIVSACAPAYGQKFSVSTNLLGYAALGTLNLDASYAVSRHWSISAGALYNPFTFHKGNPQKQFQLKQQSYYVGARLWLWHVWSGWWFASKMRYQEYNTGGIISRQTTEGDRMGLGLYSGYTYMVSRHFNVEFGLGLWGGADCYTKYSCPTCGFTMDKGVKGFLLPDDIMISLAYVF